MPKSIHDTFFAEGVQCKTLNLYWNPSVISAQYCRCGRFQSVCTGTVEDGLRKIS